MSKELLFEQKNIVITKEIVEEYLSINNIKLSEQQKKFFIAMATRFNLDPFKHEIYAISYGNRFNIVIGYEAYIKRAELSGKLNGWNVKTNFDDNGNVIGATATIYRKDWANPLVITIYKKEYEKDTAIWKSMPATMCEKIAMSKAFKLAFPLDIGEMPLSATDDDLPDDIVVNDEGNNSVSDSNIVNEFGKIADRLASLAEKTQQDVVNQDNQQQEMDHKRVIVMEKIKNLNINPDAFKRTLMKYYNKADVADLSQSEIDDLIIKIDSKIKQQQSKETA